MSIVRRRSGANSLVMRVGGLAGVCALVASSVFLTPQLLLPSLANPEFSPERSSKVMAQSSFRLPADVAVPESYEIFVDPEIEKGKFSGTESVEISILKPTQTIVLNSADLKIVNATCSSVESKSAAHKAKITFDAKAEQVMFTLSSTIKPGRYRLSIQFDGAFNDKLRGFYRARFTDPSGNKQWLATTQMEPIDARRMFPCFDEPEYKATYKLSTSIDSKLVALSNSPIDSESTDAATGKKLVTFATTPKMSSYLVALVIGPLVSTDAINSDGVPIRVWTTPGKEKLATYAQDVACNLLQFYNKYFGVPYPGKKLDLIAIPDFGPGAMENLGCITFRETYLLVDDKTGSANTKQDVASTVAHEMAHMWFGDLVTMKWWDDLWLNEAFATWMSYKAVDHLRPEWHQWDNFCLERLKSMSTDALMSTRSIHFDVIDPSQVEQMFDEITYGKGASVLRMLEKYVSENVFRDGVRRYIKAHQFSNATTQDLWKSVGDASGKDIDDMMHGWVYQTGFPLVTVARGVPNSIQVLQNRYLLRDARGRGATSPTWQIPVATRSLSDKSHDISSAANETLQQTLFKERSRKIDETGEAPYLVNAGGYGYFRVSYDPGYLQGLTTHVAHMTPLERMSLLSDQYTLAISGQVPIGAFMTMTSAFRNDEDPNVTDVFIREIRTEIHNSYTHCFELLVPEKSRNDFAAFVRDRLMPAKKRLGWTVASTDSDLVKSQRAEILETLGTCGQDSETIKEAQQLFLKYVDDQEAINPDLIDAVLNIVAYNGDQAEYEKICTLWHNAKSPEREHDALFALHSFRQPALVQRTLSMCLTDQVRTQDAPNLIGATAGTVAGRQIGWTFVSTRWNELLKRFDKHLLHRIIASAANLSTSAEYDEVKAFFKANPLPSENRSIAKVIESVQINAAFTNHNGSALSNWLAAQTDADKKAR